MLFGNHQKPLEKIPYKFSYRFKCENPKCKTHTKMIEDWEVGALFLRMRDKYGPGKAAEKVKDTFYTRICSPERDTHFFVGTVLHYGSWIILGTFWPRKTNPMLPF